MRRDERATVRCSCGGLYSQQAHEDWASPDPGVACGNCGRTMTASGFWITVRAERAERALRGTALDRVDLELTQLIDRLDGEVHPAARRGDYDYAGDMIYLLRKLDRFRADLADMLDNYDGGE